jgi:hypothetical protein
MQLNIIQMGISQVVEVRYAVAGHHEMTKFSVKFSRETFGVISFRCRGGVLTWYGTAGLVARLFRVMKDEKTATRADVDCLVANVCRLVQRVQYIAVHLMGTDQDREGSKS